MTVPVSRLRCCLCRAVDPSALLISIARAIRDCLPYLTVLASSSIGAPDSTAAGSTPPSSLPFITRLGTGEKVLGQISTDQPTFLGVPTMKLGRLPPYNLAGYV